MGDYEIRWLGEPKPEYENQLRKEIEEFDINPTRLLTHTMMLDGADFGSAAPSVHAHWDQKFCCIMAEYIPITKWTNIIPKDTPND